MKLTIIPIDGYVSKDDIGYSDLVWAGTPLEVHALQWAGSSGWIEYNNGAPNEDIVSLPEWANNALAAWDAADYAANNPPPPTPEQIQLTNKVAAVALLQQTDWATIADVSNPSISNPYLVNVAEFIAFRNQVRPTAINPPITLVTFPTMPTAQWSS